MNIREKKCPMCAETIRRDAVMCKHCRSVLPNDVAEPGVKGTKELKIAGIVACCLVVGFCVHKQNSEVHDAVERSKTSAKETDDLLAAAHVGSHGDAATNSAAPIDVAAVTAAAAAAGDAAAAADPATTSNWTYAQDEDKLRGSTSRYAQINSNNEVDLPFPYSGGSKGMILVRKRAQDGTKVIFRVQKGQILCSNFSSSHLSVKFDGGKVQRYECSSSSSGDTDVAFVEASAGFLAKLKKASHVIIEAPMYQAGSEQWDFDVAGLNWK